MTTLVVDTGQDIVGIYSVEDVKFIAYRGTDISVAIQRIVNADEVITYNGDRYDLDQLRMFAGMPRGESLPLKGIHIDMQRVCWDPILGSNLSGTYKRCFPGPYNGKFEGFYDDTHEGSAECDVYMTFKLWELWKQGGLNTMPDRPPFDERFHYAKLGKRYQVENM